MGSLVLYAAAIALVGGLGAALAFAVGGRGHVSGVAHSLALIEHNVSPHEVAQNDLPAADRLVKPFFEGMRRLAVRLSPSGTGERLVRQLDSAGNPKPWTVESIMGAKGGGLMLAGVLGFLLGGGLTARGLLIAIAAAAAGFFLPDLLLYNIAVHRQEELRRGLADALDMLTVCVEAGQGFDAALMQVARSTTGPVAGEFTRALQEIQLGKPRGEAFASVARRSNVMEMRTFVTALVQADRLGLPIGGVLREQAHQMRLTRRQRAEEKAMKVPVKILFPMLLCIFPAMFIVIIGPAGIRIADTFSHM
ncbi:MAG TPA: type II secretion system F family protein [Candidatus Limnocylindrales bacterium]